MFSTYDIRKFLAGAQPINLEFIFDGVFPNHVNGDALLLTNKLVNVSSDGKRLFNLIQP